MIAFAANSLLCRLALRSELIDAASFATVRVVAGAVALGVVLLPRWRARGRPRANWPSAAMLFTYLVFFSFAYLSLSAGTGALILFGAVQLTMFAAALRAGERLAPSAWLGLLMAVAGLVYLVAPGVTAPDPQGAALMAIAGVAWGLYSLRGRGTTAPLESTASNFLHAVPFVLVVSLLFANRLSLSPMGIVFAIASGAIASGAGYAVWYAALRGLTAGRAATVQLSVPVLAALGGAVFLSERVTLRLVVASAVTLGGVAIVIARREPSRRARQR